MMLRAPIVLLGLIVAAPPQGQGPQSRVTPTGGAGVVRSGNGSTRALVAAQSGGGVVTSPGGYRVTLNPLNALPALQPEWVRILGVQENFSLTNNDRSISIEWEDVVTREPEAVAVEVLRAESPRGAFLPIGQTAGNSFTDDGTRAGVYQGNAEVLNYGQFYLYAVRVVARAGTRGPATPWLPAVAVELGPGGAPALPGDVNGDGQITGEDLLQIAFRDGVSLGKNNPLALPAADVDLDGEIDLEDLQIAIDNLGRHRSAQ